MKKFFTLFAALMMLSASAETVTVFEGTDTNDGAPIYGYNYDSEGYITQTILPETDLGVLKGKTITGMKFYVAGENGNTLNGGTLAVSIGTTPQAAFPSWSPTAIEGLTHVADITMTAGETEIVVNFDTPFEYLGEGLNLVIETKVVEPSGWANLYFYGENALVNNVLHQRYATSTANFYPKTTFTYEDAAPAYLRGDVNGDGDVNITDVTVLIDYILNNNPVSFNEQNADTYPDNVINIADVTTLIDFLLYRTWD